MGTKLGRILVGMQLTEGSAVHQPFHLKLKKQRKCDNNFGIMAI
jgi:hypothetical protein